MEGAKSNSSHSSYHLWSSCCKSRTLPLVLHTLCVLRCFSRTQLFPTLWTISHQAPLSMGFSRQEYWRGLPCPPPGDLPNLGTEPRSLTLQVDSLPSEPPGKPKNTGVGSLFLLQGIFRTQKSNRDLLRCGRILYQLTDQVYISQNMYKRRNV